MGDWEHARRQALRDEQANLSVVRAMLMDDRPLEALKHACDRLDEIGEEIESLSEGDPDERE